MANPKLAIQTEGLSKVFGGLVVFREVCLDVVEGESVALTGANGAGKTTLLRCLASALRPTTGEVRWFGRLATASSAARRLIGVVAHETLLYPQLTLRENLIFAARMCDVREPVQRARQLLQDAGLGPHVHCLPPQISKGMRQRVAVARALVHDPPILLLDEPFANLDAEGTDWLFGLLSDLQSRKRTLCFAMHDEQKARRLADRVLHLRSGRLQELEVGGRAAIVRRLTSARAA